MNTAEIPAPVLNETDQAFCHAIIRAYPTIGWEHDELVSIVADALRLIRSIATKYTDHTRVELNFEELESEGRTKFIKRIQGTERSLGIWKKFVGRRGELFKHLKACLNNHIKGIVHRNCFTAKRTGRKAPPKDATPDSWDRSWRPEVSLDDEDVKRAMERYAANVEDPATAMALEDIGELLSPIEFLVMKQLTAPNSHAVGLAMIDSYHGRRLDAQLNIKITQDHMADGLGVERPFFKETVAKIKIKVLRYMHATEDTGHRNAAITTLETIFGVQIPRAMPSGVVRRLITLVARDNHEKITPEVDDLLKLVGAKPPNVDESGNMACFGILFQKNHRVCSVCGLRQACAAEAANYELGQVALSPKLFSRQALTWTAALSAELPTDTGQQTDAVREVAVDTGETTAAIEPATAVATPATISSAPLTERDEVIKNHIETNFAGAVFKGEQYYRHRARRKDHKTKYIFWLGQNKAQGTMALRFCRPSEKIAKQLEKHERNNYYAPVNMPVETLIKLINLHSDESFKS